MTENETVIGHTIYGISPASCGYTKATFLSDVRSGVDGAPDMALALRRADEYRAKGFTDVTVHEVVQRPIASKYPHGSAEDPAEAKERRHHFDTLAMQEARENDA